MNTIKTSPKDFFLHLGATIVLFVSAGAFINLAFSIINYAFPDQLAYGFSSSSIAWPVSMIIVLVPLLYVLEWLIGRDIKKAPEKMGIWIRRWRIYLTLFLAGATIVGDLISLINTYLSGEITARFVYKIIVIFVICGVIFAYYLMQRIEESVGTDSKKTTKLVLAYIGLVIALAGIVGGFIIVGSPATQRAIRFDEERRNDLVNIQYQITSYWQRMGKLPVSLKDLADPLSGAVIPSDPKTGESYEYISTSTRSFELCATFEKETKDLSGRGAYGGTSYSIDMSYYPIGEKDNAWNHGIGRTCFYRSIDPSRYPVIPAVPVKGL